jgi:hypothetical protein
MATEVYRVDHVRLNGKPFAVGETVEIERGSIEREGKMSANGELTGFTEKSMMPTIKITFMKTTGFNPDEINSFNGGSLAVKTISGQTYTLIKATSKGHGPESVNDGTFEMEFFGELIQVT